MNDKTEELLQTILAVLDLTEDSTTNSQRREVFILLREATDSAYSRGYSAGVASVTQTTKEISKLEKSYPKYVSFTDISWESLTENNNLRTDE